MYLCYSVYIYILDHNIYFTTTTKGIKNRTEHKITIHTTLLLLVGTDVCVRKVFVCEETGEPGGNPPVRLGDHMTISRDHISVTLCYNVSIII